MIEENKQLVIDALEQKGADPKKRNGEINASCIFSNCDEDRKPSGQGHLYISEANGTYYCHKCQAKGSFSELKAALNIIKTRSNAINDYTEYQKCIVLTVKDYLNERGISDELIKKARLGYGKFYRSTFITIPVFDRDGEYLFMKLRRYPDDQECPKYMNYPSRTIQSNLYGLDTVNWEEEYIVICEGEFDCLILKELGINAVTSTAGANTFKDEWLKYLNGFKNVYIWLDSDEVGRRESTNLNAKIISLYPDKSVITIEFTEELVGFKDISEAFIQGIKLAAYFNRIRKLSEVKIDPTSFSDMSLQQLTNILDLTIKKDNVTKVLTFLSMLTTFSSDNQINVLFNAPSSTGKSYIPSELAKFFPEENLMILGYCSPMAFFHDNSVQIAGSEHKLLNLEHKIIVLLDSPHTDLLARLRPILSHDKKEMLIKITDKVKGSNKTKNIIVRGYPVVVFCTANLEIDEQEQTRFLVLSPETSSEKIQMAIHGIVHKESNKDEYKNEIESNPIWVELRQRIRAIKESGVVNVLYNEAEFESIIMEKLSSLRLQPKDQREVKRIIDCVKSFATLNFMHRERIDEKTIKALKSDALAVLELWREVLETQRLGISPYEYGIYKEVLLVLRGQNKNDAQSYSIKEINDQYYQVYKKPLDIRSFRSKMVPKYENAGLIEIVEDEKDRRSRRYLIKEINAPDPGEIMQSLADIVE